LIRLLDGSRAYLHAVIDNFSRRILGWKVSPTFDPEATAEIMLAAVKSMDQGAPTVLTDGGVENFNGAVDELIHSGLLHRVLAGTEIAYSNSTIESWWRVLAQESPECRDRQPGVFLRPTEAWVVQYPSRRSAARILRALWM
jgi:transposase InsO family protein